MESYYFSIFISLFAVLNPLTILPTFIVLTKDASAARRFKTAVKSCVIAFIVIAAFAFVGDKILDAMKTSTDALRLSGGFLLGVIAFKMVMSTSSPPPSKSNESAVAVKPTRDISVFPMAVPMIAGPGSLTVIMTQFSEAGSDWMVKLFVLLSAAAVVGIIFISMLFARSIIRYMGEAVIDIFQRLFGLILAAFATQMIMDGATQIVSDRFNINVMATDSSEDGGLPQESPKGLTEEESMGEAVDPTAELSRGLFGPSIPMKGDILLRSPSILSGQTSTSDAWSTGPVPPQLATLPDETSLMV